MFLGFGFEHLGRGGMGNSGYVGLGDLEPAALLSNSVPQFPSFSSISFLLVLKN